MLSYPDEQPNPFMFLGHPGVEDDDLIHCPLCEHPYHACRWTMSGEFVECPECHNAYSPEEVVG